METSNADSLFDSHPPPPQPSKHYIFTNTMSTLQCAYSNANSLLNFKQL